MTSTPDHQLANVRRREKELTLRHRRILAMEGGRALDAVLSASQPATLIQSFSDQDLYYLMHHIGPDDFLPVLALASSSQWEFILDMEAWNRDRMDLVNMTRTLDLLLKADAPRLLRWSIMEKPEFLENYLFCMLEIRVREHDQDPSTLGDGFYTLDDQIYFRFPSVSETLKAFPDLLPEGAAGDGEDPDGGIGELERTRILAEEMVTRMLKILADMDMEVCRGLLLEAASVVPSEAEESEYRLRNVRLAEKGFLPYYEAVGIYQPLDRFRLKPRYTGPGDESASWHELPMPPVFPDALLASRSLFSRSLSGVEAHIQRLLRIEFSNLVNSLISADRITIRDREEIQTAVDRAGGYLSVGIEMIHTGGKDCTPVDGAAILNTYTLMDIFRTASGGAARLKQVAAHWLENSWMTSNGLPLTFLGETWMGVIGGLLLDRPLYCDQQASDVRYRSFRTLEEMLECARILGRIQAMDTLMSRMNPRIPGRERRGIIFQSLLLTLWARDSLGLSLEVAPIPLARFVTFYEALFTAAPEDPDQEGARLKARQQFEQWLCRTVGMVSLDASLEQMSDTMFESLWEEYGRVRPSDIDPELMMLHFLLEQEPGNPEIRSEDGQEGASQER